MPEISFGGLRATYDIVRCARKTLGVVINPDGKVVVRAPYSTGQSRIDDFVEHFTPWAFKHLARCKQACPSRAFVTGESLPYLGKKYKLKVVAGEAGALPVLTGGRILVYVAAGLGDELQRETVRQTLAWWYKEQARQIMTLRVEELAGRLGARPAAVKVKRQARRWGSCTARGVINLNWQLIMVPSEVLDYVIIHELCHLKVHGHQREFWEYVAQTAPDYKKLRKWLKVHGHTLNFLAD